jgi:O-antigen ligase
LSLRSSDAVTPRSATATARTGAQWCSIALGFSIPISAAEIADHPHNAFLHVGVELGLIGLAVLLMLLLVQWRSASTLSGFTERIAARGLVVIFVVAGLVSSTFWDHSEGLFYAWATGLLYATARRPGKEAR